MFHSTKREDEILERLDAARESGNEEEYKKIEEEYKQCVIEIDEQRARECPFFRDFLEDALGKKLDL